MYFIVGLNATAAAFFQVGMVFQVKGTGGKGVRRLGTAGAYQELCSRE